MDDAAAVKRVLAGNQEAFADLVREHGSGVLRLAARVLPSRELAEDVAQETFLRAYSNLASYDPRYPFRSWLYRIASNLCVDALRRWKAAPSSVSMDAVSEADVAGTGPAAGGLERGAAGAGDPALEAEKAEAAAAVRAAVRDLAPEYRLLVVMAHFEGMKNDEIAEATGLSPGLVKNRLYRARRMLRAKLSWLSGAGALVDGE
ncbi:MAG: sigma-70 family RNA polymerase sigma factor [Firmicutes bacterium]|nr:sigma-70 family RNA polymerase sigma factor [Bacillota bacterium]